MEENKIQFWYDVRAVSGSHAEVTVSIAGLSLALLLILPIFTGNSNTNELTEQIINSSLFFFFSLAFGILASFGYSVQSGDTRPEPNRILIFSGPSVAFGLSVPLLFLGFIYIISVYWGDKDIFLNALNIMRFFTLISLWASAVLITRTIIEGAIFYHYYDEDASWLDAKWFKDKMALVMAAMYLVTLLPIYLYKSVNFDSINWKYFSFLAYLGFFSITYQTFVRYSVRQGKGKIIALAATGILLLSYIIFVFWTAITII